MTDYLIRLNRVPGDIPRDVLVEHLAVAVQKIQKGRKALKKVGIQIIDVTNDVPRKGRKHPFDGPEVNDDLPEPFARGGFLPGNASTSLVAGDTGYVLSRAQVEAMGGGNLPEFFAPKPDAGVPIFSGRSEDQNYDTVIRAFVPVVPEETEAVVVEFDVEDILPDLYQAIADDFPHLAELFEAKRAEHQERQVRRNADITDPPAEGDWELDSDDRVGDDL
jgi:hypothetical protein